GTRGLAPQTADPLNHVHDRPLGQPTPTRTTLGNSVRRQTGGTEWPHRSPARSTAVPVRESRVPVVRRPSTRAAEDTRAKSVCLPAN
ncbi:hypothetical protein, partial [Streptomyces sp. 900105245]